MKLYYRACLLLVCIFSIVAQSKVSLRTSVNDINEIKQDRLYVALDFSVLSGEHIYAPKGKGKSLAPCVAWKNAKVIDVIWSKCVDLLNSDGSNSGYVGYDKDFSLMYELEIKDKTRPIEYDLTYISCGSSCVPVQTSGVLKMNGLLSKTEILKTFGKQEVKFSSFIIALLFGILGGIILNCMPCVFPIISMKVFSIVKTANSNKRYIRKHGLAVTAGTIVTFKILGISLLLLRDSVNSVGWGFYMQSPL
ncbi:MAG: hypothetical protein LBF70_00430, partial [Holosporales bacterium]|nr:hypothetical protein [Holosporales bacterium]